MTVQDVQKIIERWAPQEIAWERDNIGLQAGALNGIVRGILVCLDVNEEIIHEAQARSANLIISHHPLLFRPLRSVNLLDGGGRCLEQLLRSRISLYSAHTNLDFSRGGTSFALAERLGLMNVDFLRKSYRLNKKIVTFVPSSHVNSVAEAMSHAGAGNIGNYESCSFRSQGIGTFKGNARSKPTVGTQNNFEHVQETRLEMVVDQTTLRSVVQALREAHPYEEAAYDIYPLENISADYGMGIIGELAKPLPVRQFISHVKNSLKSGGIRSSHALRLPIHRVAACGGSGAELTDDAIRQGADAFITADIKYHAFQDVTDRILLVDAGHYETERPVVDTLVTRLKQEFKSAGERIPVSASRISSNPIVYH